MLAAPAPPAVRRPPAEAVEVRESRRGLGHSPTGPSVSAGGYVRCVFLPSWKVLTWVLLQIMISSLCRLLLQVHDHSV